MSEIETEHPREPRRERKIRVEREKLRRHGSRPLQFARIQQIPNGAIATLPISGTRYLVEANGTYRRLEE